MHIAAVELVIPKLPVGEIVSLVAENDIVAVVADHEIGPAASTSGPRSFGWQRDGLWMAFHDLAQCCSELTKPRVHLWGVDGSEAEDEPARGGLLYDVL
jgi:hypothetical protein